MRMTEYRVERDTMGEVRLPKEAYYGAQTQRAVENFPISGQTAPPNWPATTVSPRKRKSTRTTMLTAGSRPTTSTRRRSTSPSHGRSMTGFFPHSPGRPES